MHFFHGFALLRKFNGKRCAHPHGAGDGHLNMMFFENAGNHSQPQTHAVAFGGKEGIADVLQILSRDSFSRVHDLDFKGIFLEMVLICSVPPAAMASLAFKNKLTKTCTI